MRNVFRVIFGSMSVRLRIFLLLMFMLAVLGIIIDVLLFRSQNPISSVPTMRPSLEPLELTPGNLDLPVVISPIDERLVDVQWFSIPDEAGTLPNYSPQYVEFQDGFVTFRIYRWLRASPGPTIYINLYLGASRFEHYRQYGIDKPSSNEVGVGQERNSMSDWYIYPLKVGEGDMIGLSIYGINNILVFDENTDGTWRVALISR